MNQRSFWSPGKGRRLKLAYFSPLPPIASGVADYSGDLLPLLARQFDLTLFTPDPSTVSHEIDRQFKIRPLSDYPGIRLEFDLPIYQMGNSIHHDFVYRQALRYPGIVVLHDYFIGHLLATINGSDVLYGNYIRELAYNLGLAGIELGWQVRYSRRPYPLFSLPLNRRLLDRAVGVIVHSRYGARLLQDRLSHERIGLIPQMMAPRTGQSLRDRLVDDLNMQPDSVLFASLGQVTANKQIDKALRAFARLLNSHPNCRYLVIGGASPDVDLAGLIQELDLGRAVHWTGYVSGLQNFLDWISTADVVVNLRQPTLGETSAAVLRSMAAGQPVVVTDHGWYSELPDDVCVKIPPGDQEALYLAMLELVEDAARRERTGLQALSYIKQHHDPAACARLYGAFFENILAQISSKYSGETAAKISSRESS